nr:hypothetical protein [uncultured Acetobacter sp.]
MRDLTSTEMDNVSGGTFCLIAAAGLSVLALAAFFTAISPDANHNTQANSGKPAGAKS